MNPWPQSIEPARVKLEAALRKVAPVFETNEGVDEFLSAVLDRVLVEQDPKLLARVSKLGDAWIAEAARNLVHDDSRRAVPAAVTAKALDIATLAARALPEPEKAPSEGGEAVGHG